MRIKKYYIPEEKNHMCNYKMRNKITRQQWAKRGLGMIVHSEKNESQQRYYNSKLGNLIL